MAPLVTELGSLPAIGRGMAQSLRREILDLKSPTYYWADTRSPLSDRRRTADLHAAALAFGNIHPTQPTPHTRDAAARQSVQGRQGGMASL